MSEPLYKDFRKRRANQRNLGIVLIVLGLLLLVSIRLRVRLPIVLWLELIGGIALLVVGWILFATAYRAPYREVLLLAEARRAAITPTDLVTEMDLELENARTLLQRMAQKGILTRAENVEAYLLSAHAPKGISK